MNRRASRLAVVRRLPRDAESFYAISDMATIRRLGALLWVFGALIVAVLMAVSHPTVQGEWGWAIGVGAVLVSLAAAYPMVRWPERMTGNVLLAMSFLATGLLTLLVWVGGQPYSELFLLPVVYASTVHPPRRAAFVYLAVAAGLTAPLVYHGWNAMVAAEDVAELMLWYAMGLVAMIFSGTVRLQRLELMAHEQEASRLARRDPLTGLGNRRAFDEALARVVEGARRSDRPLCLVLGDIRDFKSINDTHGHLEGDRCLREVAAVLAATVRPSDSCFRWGGDEFAVFLPGATPEHAATVVRRVIEAVTNDIAAPGGEPVTLRFGVAEVQPGMSAEDVVAAADLALMAERSAG